MYENKYDSKHTFEDLLNEVKSDFWGIAITYRTLSISPISEKIVEMVKMGKKFKILVINPEPNKDKTNNKEPEFLKLSEGLIVERYDDKEIKLGLERIREKIFNRLSKEEKQRFEVKWYNLPIIHTMILIDPQDDDGKLQLEPFCYMSASTPTPVLAPVFMIERRKRKEVFNKLKRSFETVFDDKNKAREIPWDTL